VTRRILIVAGEASGDHHGAGLAAELRRLAPEVSLSGLAGPSMATAGVEVLVPVSQVAVVGVTEVISNLPRIRRAFKTLVKAMDERRPDLVLLIDYPDFNLRLAKEARRRGLPVLYYVSPQVWAWRAGRIRTIAKRVNRMMVLFPFEEELYRSAGVPVTWVGHPLADEPDRSPDRAGARRALGLKDEDSLLALLPGSRPSEVERILPVLVESARILAPEDPRRTFLVPVAPTLDPAIVQRLCAGSPARPWTGALPELLAAADAAAVASGTATLQAALAGVPFVIVYRVQAVTAFLGRRFMRIRDIGLANLVAGRRVAEELVQEDFTPARVAGALRWLLQPEAAAAARHGLASVREKLGPPGASRRAAEVVLDMLEEVSRRSDGGGEPGAG
jgi:lipid-A-disaccharide synthase